MASSIALPEGFVLDGHAAGANAPPPLPEGFVLDGATPQQSPSFLGEMKQNTANAVQSGGDLLSGNFSFPGYNNPTGPRTQALADKLFPEGSGGSVMDALPHVGDAVSSGTAAGALLEKFGETPAGKGLSVIGAHPVFNAIGTGLNRYVNPYIIEKTGIAPENLQLLELGLGTLGIKKAGQINDPLVSAAKYAGGKIWDSATGTAKTLANGVSARSPDTLLQTAEDMKSNAVGVRNQMKANGAVLNQDAINTLSTNIDAALSDKKIIPELSPKTLAIIKDIKGAANFDDTAPKVGNNGEIPTQSSSIGRPASISLDDLDQYGRFLSRVGSTEDGVVAGAVKNAIKNTLNNLQPTDLAKGGTEAVDLLNQFKKDYARSSRFEDVSNILAKADGDPNKIKSGLTRFVQNTDNLRGFSQQEIRALKIAAKSTVPEKILKGFGKFGVDLGTSFTPGNTVAPLIGAYANPALPVIGTAARQVQKYLARGKAESALQAIEGGVEDNPASVSTSASPMLPSPTSPLSGAAGVISQQKQLPLVQTPAVTLPGASAPSTMPVHPLPELLPQSSVDSSIKNAADTTGVDPNLLHAIAATESSLNPEAKAKTSSASGLFQITKPTFRRLVEKYGKQYGITMRDVMNPDANAIMAAHLTAENSDSLGKALGREITPGESYIAHFLGARGAAMLLKADPNKPAYKLFPQAAKANRSLFFDERRPRTVGELAYNLESKVESKMPQAEEAAAPPQESMADVSHIPIGAAKELKKNPKLIPQFEEVFGPGTAKAILTA